MKNMITLCLFVSFSASLNAQFWLPISDKVDLMKDRILLVESEDFECNPLIMDHVKKYWKYSTDIQSKTAEEITGLLTLENSKKYLVLTGDVKEENRVVQGKAQLETVQCIVLYLGENAGFRNERSINREFLAKMSLPSCLVSESEVKFFFQHVDNQIKYISELPASSNRKKSKIDPKTTLTLRDKTLLVPKECIDAEPSSYDHYYKWPVQLAEASEIKSAIQEEKVGFAYVTVLWSDKRFEWSLVAIDCASGEILAVAKFGKFDSNVNSHKFDSETELLSIYRGREKISFTEMKYLGKEVSKAEMNAR